MSAKKRKVHPASDIEHIFARLEDTLVQVKVALGAGTDGDGVGDAVPILYELATLAEQFSTMRHKADKEWLSPVLDTLDREGTALWNISGSISLTPDHRKPPLAAALRLSSYRLIEAGSPSKPGPEDCIHLLQLASKAGAMLSKIGKADLAGSTLTSAAQYEEKLREVEDPQQSYLQPMAQATVVYYCSRMEAAWKEGNDGLAEYMLQRISDDERLVHVTVHDREMLASKVLEIGRSLLSGDCRNDGPSEERAHGAVVWIQKALTLADKLDEAAIPGVAELKRSILRNLARAYVLSSAKHPEHLARAEISLRELLTSVGDHKPGSASNHDDGEFQELRWWMLAVLKRRNAGNEELLEAFQSIVANMAFSEESVTRLVQELRMVGPQQNLLAVSVLQSCLHRYLASADDAALACLDQIVLSLIFQCSRSQNHAAAVATLRESFDPFLDAGFHLSKISATACVMLFWQFAHQHLRANRHAESSEWYLLGTHGAFRSIAELCHDKCCRKAALCYIEMHEYSHATVAARRCAQDSALTQYILLLIAVRQGVEDEAIQAVRAMAKAVDFDRKMLLIVTKLAHEADLKTLLLFVLEELLNSVQQNEAFHSETEAITLARCTIRLVVRLMADPTAASRSSLIDALIKHFGTARDIVRNAVAQKGSALIIKDISWLWRTAYNCATQGCAEWENPEEKVPILFDIAGELIQAYCHVVVQIDEEVHLAIILASFAATSARVFSVRHQAGERVTNSEAVREDGVQISTQKTAFPSYVNLLADVSQATYACERTIRGIIERDVLKTDCIDTALQCLRAVLVFEAELAIFAGDWDKLPAVIENIAGLPAELVDTLEAVTDMLWAEQNCPHAVLFPALEKILHASLDSQALSVDRFARWLRAICVMLLSRNTTPDRLKAVAYIEQAVAVLSEHSGDSGVSGEAYPVDERYWLLTTSYNTGIECLHIGLLDEAKRWFEISTMFCRYVPDGEASSRKISETYTLLLKRYSS